MPQYWLYKVDGRGVRLEPPIGAGPKIYPEVSEAYQAVRRHHGFPNDAEGFKQATLARD